MGREGAVEAGAQARPWGEWRTGDLFMSGANCLVCPVNTRGPMGRGIAVPFLGYFPKASAAYQRAARSPPGAAMNTRPGRSMFEEVRRFGVELEVPLPDWIAFFATKDDWREDSRTRALAQRLSGSRGRRPISMR